MLRTEPSYGVSAYRFRSGLVAVGALPHWPAMMKRPMAADYCQLSIAEFEREVAEGRLPMPVKLGNYEHWSKARLDEALDRLTADNSDWFSGSPLYSDKAA